MNLFEKLKKEAEKFTPSEVEKTNLRKEGRCLICGSELFQTDPTEPQEFNDYCDDCVFEFAEGILPDLGGATAYMPMTKEFAEELVKKSVEENWDEDRCRFELSSLIVEWEESRDERRQ